MQNHTFYLSMLFWVVTPFGLICSYLSLKKCAASTFMVIRVHTVSQPRPAAPTSSLQREHQITYIILSIVLYRHTTWSLTL
jgi:hypothetical protein